MSNDVDIRGMQTYSFDQTVHYRGERRQSCFKYRSMMQWYNGSLSGCTEVGIIDTSRVLNGDSNTIIGCSAFPEIVVLEVEGSLQDIDMSFIKSKIMRVPHEPQ